MSNLAERFISLFAGLSRSHGTYDVPAGTLPDGKGKLNGNAITVPTGPSIPLWAAHLAGEKSLGVVPIMADSTCIWGCLDVDNYQDFDLAKLLEKSHNGLNLPLILVRSKSGGCHMFLFAAEPVPAKLMRARLAECRDALGLPERTEIFPKQEVLNEANGSGGWLNMPYFGLEEPGPAYGGRYGIMPWGVCQSPEEFLDYSEGAKLEPSWFAKPVAYMQAPGAAPGKKKKTAEKPPPAYKNGLEDAHYPELQSMLAYYIGENGPPKELSNGEIDLRILSMLDAAAITDPAKRREYTQELRSFGYKKRDEDQGKEPRKKGLLQKLCADFTYFNAGSMREGFVQLTRGDHFEVWSVNDISNEITNRHLDITGEAPKREELNTVMDGIKARCNRFESQEIHSRIARTPDKIYLDLCNAKWEAVEIDEEGWRVVSNPPVYFRRANEMQELPIPVPGGSLDELRPLLNAGDDDQWTLMMGWLVGVFQPEGAFSHIAIEGQEGSAKTTTSVNLISLVDPNKAGLSGPPKDEQDFSITAMSAGIVGFDNFSGCKASLSDIFCRCSTGMSFRTRKLYTDTGITSITLRIPLLFNGIDSVVMRGDLLRRTIVVHLPVINRETRKTTKYLEERYREAHPRILGALLDAVACGLKNFATTVVTNPPSMADFAQWVKACEPNLPWASGTFLTTYHNMQLDASDELFEKDQFAVAVFDWVWPKIQGDKTLEITGRELLTSLNKTIHIDKTKIEAVDQKEWPKFKDVHNYVNRTAPLLLKKGMRVEETKRTSKIKPRWRFELVTAQRKLAEISEATTQ